MRGGHLDVLEYALQHNCPTQDDTFCAAALDGNVDVYRMLYAVRPFVSYFVLAIAARGGHLAMLEHVFACAQATLLETESLSLHNDLISCAAFSGSIPCVRFLREHGVPWGGIECTIAIESGRIGLLQWLVDQGAPCVIPQLLDVAKGFAWHDIVAWLRERDALGTAPST